MKRLENNEIPSGRQYISGETANFLRQFNFDVKSLVEADLSHLTDAEVVELAKKEKRIIITFDLDFAEIFYFLEQKHFWRYRPAS